MKKYSHYHYVHHYLDLHHYRHHPTLDTYSSVKIVRKKETGQSLGYGFIVFDIEYNALQAIQVHVKRPLHHRFIVT
jgi:RNA recognition motif-containing protein